MEINRPDLISNLLEYVTVGNGIIVGPPGIGKTHSINIVFEILNNQWKKVLFLRIDRLGDGSDNDLKSILELNTNLIDKLRIEGENNPNKPGIVFFDGFDAARNIESKNRFLKIIHQTIGLGNLWNVIVSVRSYDAQKSQDLLRLFNQSFKKDSQTYSDINLPCRNFSIPILNQNEIDQSISQIQGLKPIYDNGSKDLRDLLKIPFNLWLLNEISKTSKVLPSLNEVSSAVQLLKLYWKERISNNFDSEARDHLLTKALHLMIKNHTLSIRKESLYEVNFEKVWDGLLSDNILAFEGSSNQRISFSHNILFDFAVSKLLLDDNPKLLKEYLSEDLARPLFLLPSLDFHFTRLWLDFPEIFWKSFDYLINVKEQNIRLFSRITLPSVIAKETRNLDELKYLLDPPHAKIGKVNKAILYVLQAIRALNIKRDNLWVTFMESLSEHPDRIYIGDLSLLTSHILDRISITHQEDSFKSIGRISRHLLKWLLEQRNIEHADWIDGIGSNVILPIVIRTYHSDLESSRSLLTEIINLLKIENYPINYIYRLSENIDQIWPWDPEFVALIYITLSAYKETSSEDTHFGGTVLNFTSNRRQDFSMIQYQLIWKYPEFLKAQPLIAYRTGLDSVNSYVVSEHIISLLKDQHSKAFVTKTFTFLGKTAHYVPDYSYIWGQGSIRDEMMKIADEVYIYLIKLASNDNQNELDIFLDIFVDHATAAYLWARLIEAACNNVDVFSSRLYELFLAAPILTNPETIYQISSFLELASPKFSPYQIEKIEEFLLSLPDSQGKRFIAKIPTNLLRTSEAQTIKKLMEVEGNVHENKPFATVTSWSKAYTAQDFLQDKGVDISYKDNADFIAIFNIFDGFIKKWENKSPSIDSVTEILPMTEKIHSMLLSTTSASEEVIELTWTKLGEVMSTIARCLDLDKNEFAIAKEVLLDCAISKFPEVENVQSNDDDFLGWSPSPRHAAAEGLMWLAIKSPDNDILIGISLLVNDPVKSIGYLVLINLWRISESIPETFWNIANQVSMMKIPNTQKQALCFSVGQVLPKYQDKGIEVLKKLLDTSDIFSKDSEFLKCATNLIMGLIIFRNNLWANDVYANLLSSPKINAYGIMHSVYYLQRLIDPQKIVNDSDKVAATASLDLLIKTIDAFSLIIGDIRSLPANDENESKEEIKTLFRVVDNLVSHLYYSSGINDNHVGKTNKEISKNDLQTYFNFIKPLLIKILDGNDGNHGVLPAPTAHHLMKLLNGMLSIDPTEVLHFAYQVALSSRPFGYNLDSLAIMEVVKLVERILADYRDEVQDDDSIQNLVGLLDIFVDTGWPQALNLVWRLDEVYR